MVRHVRDPWAKKTRKGMKRLGSIGKLAAGAGAVVAHEYKTAKNRPPAEPLKISPLGYNYISSRWDFKCNNCI